MSSSRGNEVGVLLMLVLALASCGSKEDKPPAASDPPAPTAAPAQPAAPPTLAKLEVGDDEQALHAWGMAASQRLLDAVAGKPQPAEGPTPASDLRHSLTASKAHLFGKHQPMKPFAANVVLMLSKGDERISVSLDLWGDDARKVTGTPVSWWQLRHGTTAKEPFYGADFTTVNDPAALAQHAPFLDAVARRTLSAIGRGSNPDHARSALAWSAGDDPRTLVRLGDRPISPALLEAARQPLDPWTLTRVELQAWYVPTDPSVPHGTQMVTATANQFFGDGKAWLGDPEPEGVWTQPTP